MSTLYRAECRSVSRVSDPRGKDDALKAMLDEMANFVLTQMPEKSFQILKEIEDITSLEVLAATLGGYGQMVSDLGQIGTTHLLSIQTNLREHL